VTHRFVVGAPPDGAGAGDRLDQFLAARDLPYTRSQLKRRIDAGEVTVNGEPAKPGRKLHAGDEIAFAPPPAAAPAALAPEPIALRVLYEDRYLIAIDKPAGLVVHPAAGHAGGTLVNALLSHCHDLAGIGGELRPGIVHRLDKDTSGVLVASKDDETHAALGALFKAKDLRRLYLAVVSPAPPPGRDAGTIRTRYARHPVHRKRFTSRVAEGKGKPATTHWRVLERFGARAALLECRLETGRTHQIRVHLAESGHPVVGDRTYGRPPRDPELRAWATRLGRQALHAAVLELRHPRTGAVLDLRSPLPDDIRALVDALRAASGKVGG
jgi:23S rRNA pseudouridine1911/1915/1917 synthase